MRIPAIATVFLLAVAACSGDDLLLPDAAPAQLRVVSGDGQTAQAGDPLLHPLIIEVLDGSGRPIPGAPVVFEFLDPPRGAEISAPTTETDVAGRASAQVTLGNAAGDQPVVARLNQPGTDLHVQFLLTALQRNEVPPPSPPPPGNGGGGNEGGDGGGGGGGGAGPAPPPQPPPPDNGGGGGGDRDKGKDKGKDDHGHGGKGKDKHD